MLEQATRESARGEHALAVEQLPALVRVAPDLATAWRRLVPPLLVPDRAENAQRAVPRCVELEPASFDDLYALAMAREAAGQISEAIGAATTAAALRPDSSRAWALLAHLRARSGDHEGSIPIGRRALILDAGNVVARYNLAVCLQSLDRLEEAEVEYRAVLSVDGRHLGAWLNLGALLRSRGRAGEAIATWRSAIERVGAAPELLFNLACALIQAGSWLEGWPGYERRWAVHGWRLPLPADHAPQWQGQPMPDGRLLVCHEQGLGDTLQFVRLLSLLSGRVGGIDFSCPARLHRLLQSSDLLTLGAPGSNTRVRLLDDGDAPPPAGAWAPLLSLPMLVGLTRATLRADVPYLAAEPDRVAHWRARLESLCEGRLEGLLVGICWQGNPAAPADRGRSPPLASFLSLARAAGVRLVSLQKGAGREQLSSLSLDRSVIDLGGELDNGSDAFVDTAAVLTSLDLLVTSDTSVAHLAGALGRPVWTVLKFVPDWRWGLATGRSPWYPTMRLFHQPSPGDWPGAFARVEAALGALVDLRRSLLGCAPKEVDPRVVVDAHRAGRTAEAIEGYRQLLRRGPDRADLLQLLAVAILEQGGRSPASAEQALVCAERAADLSPRDPDVHANLGLILKCAGRFDDAETTLLQALALTGWSHGPAAINLVNLLVQRGAGSRAVEAAERALIVGVSADKLAALARALHAAGRPHDAIATWRRVIAAEPGSAAHRVALGAALSNTDPAGATLCFEQALELEPDNADALTDLGVLERAAGTPDLAIWFQRRAVSARRDHVEAWTNLGVSLLECGEVVAAQDAFREALKRRPQHADALMALGMSLLLQGRLEEGFEAYEHRRRSSAAGPAVGPPAALEWAGGDPRGLRLLLVAEQGLGDAIQFVRYAAVLKDRGARAVAIGCRAPLARLLAGAAGVDEVVVEGAALPPFDAWAPLMSLPRLVGTTLDTVPAPVPYLMPEPERAARWASVLADRPGLRVGVAWQGNPDRRVDAGRSIPLARLEPLAQIPGVRLVSLQKGFGSEQLASSRLPIEQLVPELDPGPDAFLDTAAVMASLDLVVTTDTAIAHLAGALGRPVWLLLRHPPEWRWLLDRTDTPWYPTMRLFRQGPTETAEDPWTPVVSRLAAELRLLALGDRSRLIPAWCKDDEAGALERAATGEGAPKDHEGVLASALALHRAGDRAGASKRYARILAERPDHAEAMHMLGVLAVQEGRHQRALIFLRAAERAGLRTPELASNLALAMKGLGRAEEAERLLREAVERRPDYTEALVNLGNLLRETDRSAEAVQAFGAACRYGARSSPALRGLGNALRETGASGAAIEALQAAVEAAPDDAEAHLDLAHALLAAGELAKGFAEYEWRWRSAEMRPRNFQTPRWDGRPFQGRVLLVHGEQGLGDHIMLARLLEPTARLGSRVVLECRPELHRLLGQLTRDIAGLSLAAQAEEPPPHDLQAPLGSLPHLLGLELTTIPCRVPYLRSEPSRREHWRARLGGGHEPRIGLAWQGNPRARADRGRSVPLVALAPVLRTGDTRFVSLQKEHGLEQRHRFPEGARVEQPAPPFDDGPDAFLDTAALLDELDLVITSDTAVAHLAGALGRPVWLLLKFAPDWRWLTERRDSPWYPTMRLYRQPRPGDWASVGEEVARDLRDLVAGLRCESDSAA